MKDECTDYHPLRWGFDLKSVSTCDIESNFLIIYLTTGIREIYHFKCMENCEFMYGKLLKDLKNSQK